FSGTVHNATHDTDFNTFQVVGAFPDHRGCHLQIKQGPSTRRTTYILRLRHTVARRLQYSERRLVATFCPLPSHVWSLVGCFHRKHHTVTQSIDKQPANVGGGIDHKGIFIGEGITSAYDDWDINITRYQ